MQLNDINNDVLRGILKYAMYSYFSGLESWKDSLYLLSVCRRWRVVSLPLVCKNAYIVYNDNDFDEDMDTDKVTDQDTNAAIITNLGIISASDCTTCVRNMNIKLFFDSEPLAGLGSVLKLLRNITATWSKVNSLMISLNHDISYTDQAVASTREQEPPLKPYALAIHSLMPGIRKLQFRGTNVNSAARDFYGKLAGSYSDQLNLLHSRHPISLHNSSRFIQITTLDIRLSTNPKFSISPECASSLINLSLRGIPLGYEWVEFSKSNGSRSIAFPNLRTLQMQYSLHSGLHPAYYKQPTKHPLDEKMYFPKLRKLNVWNSNNHCMLLTSAVFPETMASIELVGSSELFGLVSKASLPKSTLLSLSVVSTSPDYVATTVPSINRIVSRPLAHSDIHLTVLEDAIPIDPQIVEWTNVTHLQLASPINMHTLIGLLKQLPKVAQLIVYNFLMEGIPDKAFAVANSSCKDSLPPLNTHIKKLMLDYNRNAYSDEDIAATIKYMSLRLTSLRVFGAWITFDTEMTTFIESYRNAYPHLNHLVYKLGMV